MTALIMTAYIVGSINTSIILFKLLGIDDPRKHHSKNAGVSNVYRRTGLFWAIVVLFIDVGKAAFISYLSIKFLTIAQIPFVGLMLIIGNRFTCFHGFKGGKGVAAYIGFTAMVSPVFTLISLGVWVLVFAIFKITFVASFATILCLSIGFARTSDWQFAATTGIVLITLFILFNHAQNISELRTRNKSK